MIGPPTVTPQVRSRNCESTGRYWRVPKVPLEAVLSKARTRSPRMWSSVYSMKAEPWNSLVPERVTTFTWPPMKPLLMTLKGATETFTACTASSEIGERCEG